MWKKTGIFGISNQKKCDEERDQSEAAHSVSLTFISFPFHCSIKAKTLKIQPSLSFVPSGTNVDK